MCTLRSVGLCSAILNPRDQSQIFDFQHKIVVVSQKFLVVLMLCPNVSLKGAVMMKSSQNRIYYDAEGKSTQEVFFFFFFISHTTANKIMEIIINFLFEYILI